MGQMNVKVSIDDESIASLLTSGFEGGSNHWLRIMDYQKPADPKPHLAGLSDEIFPHVDYPLAPDGAVICRDVTVEDEEDNDFTALILNRVAIERGLSLMSTKAPHAFASIMNDTADALTGDCFLQLCLLGEVRYG